MTIWRPNGVQNGSFWSPLGCFEQFRTPSGRQGNLVAIWFWHLHSPQVYIIFVSLVYLQGDAINIPYPIYLNKMATRQQSSLQKILYQQLFCVYENNKSLSFKKSVLLFIFLSILHLVLHYIFFCICKVWGFHRLNLPEKRMRNESFMLSVFQNALMGERYTSAHNQH